MIPKYKFAPAAATGESIVFGAQRPGFPETVNIPASTVQEWITFMQAQGIRQVCCLLAPEQLKYYAQDLLKAYQDAFGTEQVLWAPVEDYHLADRQTLTECIMPFLDKANIDDKPVVVHCSGGIGRTGHVLAAWLVHRRGFSIQDAIQAVLQSGRNAEEAVHSHHATAADLHALLAACRS